MTVSPIEQEILTHLHRLGPNQQQHVLTFIRSLTTVPPGTPGHALLAFAGHIPAEELAAMERAIEDGCEQVDDNEW